MSPRPSPTECSRLGHTLTFRRASCGPTAAWSWSGEWTRRGPPAPPRLLYALSRSETEDAVRGRIASSGRAQAELRPSSAEDCDLAIRLGGAGERSALQSRYRVENGYWV